jgi:hypothetical protein
MIRPLIGIAILVPRRPESGDYCRNIPIALIDPAGRVLSEMACFRQLNCSTDDKCKSKGFQCNLKLR